MGGSIKCCCKNFNDLSGNIGYVIPLEKNSVDCGTTQLKSYNDNKHEKSNRSLGTVEVLLTIPKGTYRVWFLDKKL